MKPTPAEKQMAEDIWACFLAEELPAAKELLAEALATSRHPRFRRIQARFMLLEGDEAGAGALLKSLVPEIWQIGAWEYALAGAVDTLAVRNDDQKIIFFPIRKCASTSMLNVMRALDGGASRGEHIHQELDAQRVVQLKDLMGPFADYFKCALVRDPLERLMSYYFGNIAGRDHLVVETGGKDSFYGLETRPSLASFIDQFDRYRQVFVTVRNHTEPVISFIGRRPEELTWIGNVADLKELIDRLEARTGRTLPRPRDMASPRQAASKDAAQQVEPLRRFYAEDYKLYGRWF